MPKRTLEQLNELFDHHVTLSTKRQDDLDEKFGQVIGELRGLRDDFKGYTQDQARTMKPLLDVYTGSSFMWKVGLGLIGVIGAIVGIIYTTISIFKN